MITMPDGTTYVIVIDTRQYSGNFEREMAGYVIGTVDVHGSHGQREADAFWDAARASGEEGHARATALHQKLTLALYEERHPVSCTIWPTPGRVNLGGPHVDAAPGIKGAPAYESVGILLSQAPTATEMALVRHRAAEFARTYHEFPNRRKLLKIVDVRVERHHVVRTETVTPYEPTDEVTA